MRTRRARGFATATAVALTFGAGVVFPRALGDGRATFSTEAPPEACHGPGCEPGPPGWVERVEARLELRIPSIVQEERRRLARAVVAEAWSARIDPLLVLALIEVESSYDHAAVSERGARGLMQLREPTLRREVQRAGLEQRDLHDPVVNVQAGVRYLRRLLDAFGREELALMAYNAGPNRILGYLRSGEIPDRFRFFPRKVKAEVRRLRRAFGEERGPALALVPPASGWPAVAE